MKYANGDEVRFTLQCSDVEVPGTRIRDVKAFSTVAIAVGPDHKKRAAEIVRVMNVHDELKAKLAYLEAKWEAVAEEHRHAHTEDAYRDIKDLLERLK